MDDKNRIESFDLIRSFCILTVFLGHILNEQLVNPLALLAVRSLSPGLTMSLLGFISGALLSRTQDDFGTFLVRRFTRIYAPLFVCLGFVLLIHALMGKHVASQHALLHLFGLSGLFEVFLVSNKATIGGGLWFITAILMMYLLLPLLATVFRHRNGLVHLVLIVVGCTALQFLTYGTQSLWNVVISFCVGLFLGVNGRLEPMRRNARIAIAVPFSASLIVICALATAGVLPSSIRSMLFAFYPLAFVPCFVLLSDRLPKSVMKTAVLFSGLSYEFYILHFYFINDNFYEVFPRSVGLLGHLIIAFIATLTLSVIFSRIASRAGRSVNKYLLSAEA
jgi:peptidoglycan/LPS O-acetylase OafA/YrhL